MIHYSAYHGSPVIQAFAARSFLDLHAPMPVYGTDTSVSYASAASTILSTTSSVLNASTGSRGVIGGGLLNGERIALLEGDVSAQMLGLLAIWSAGGEATLVSAQDAADFGWVNDLRPAVMLYPAGDSYTDASLVYQHDWTPLSTTSNPLRVPFSIQPSQRADAEANPDRGYTTVSDEDVVQMMRNLEHIELDRPALFVPSSVRLAVTSRGVAYTDGQAAVADSDTDRTVADRTAVARLTELHTGENDATEGKGVVMASEDKSRRGDAAGGSEAPGSSACWAASPRVAEGTTYSHRDIAAFVLGIDPSSESRLPAHTRGLDRVPVLVALANLLKPAGPSAPLPLR